MKHVGRHRLSSLLLVAVVVGCEPQGAVDTGPTSAQDQDPLSVDHTAAQLLALNVRPIAIGHHGAGNNLGEIPNKPIQNTVPSVQLAYDQGASAVEIDVQLTRDGTMAVFHDDFLADFTCVNTLSISQLSARVGYTVPSLGDVLQVAKRVNKGSQRLTGILIVEMKALSPHCDPRDSMEGRIVASTVAAIRIKEMTRATILDSFSPALLLLAKQAAPEIPRELDLDLLQLLTPDQVAAATGLPVTLINKRINVGLQWAEIGPVFRLPGYSSPTQFLQTGFVVGAQLVGAEQNFLAFAEQSQPGSGAAFIAGAQAAGFKTTADVAKTLTDWNFFASLGANFIYTDDVVMGVGQQPVFPHGVIRCRSDERCRSAQP
jgi:glycerophosphoryl diester phosphodiesterase